LIVVEVLVEPDAVVMPPKLRLCCGGRLAERVTE
jgi:hypothetical protein